MHGVRLFVVASATDHAADDRRRHTGGRRGAHGCGRPPMCIPRGGNCTTDSDCCMGFLCIPVGPDLICEVPII